jgi:hypothetical protein
MSDPTDPAAPPAYKHSEAAPFIYFDFAPTFGILGGAVQIELAARTLIPNVSGGPVGVEFVSTAHLRCSPMAALELKQALEQALEMLQGPPQGGEGTGAIKH